MTQLAVSGYASLDYAFALAGQIAGDRTTLIEHRDPAAWPRAGGCPSYLAMAVADTGQIAQPVSWVGSDSDADVFLQQLLDRGIDIAGIARLEEDRSPTAILAYQADGTCACLFDPAFSGNEQLTEKQHEIIAAASHLCISVGPPQLIDQILNARASSSRLYWVLKNDANCFSPAICQTLSHMSDVIFCSRSERRMICETGTHTTIVETRGSDEIRVQTAESVETLSVKSIEVRDTTGAGDSFAGGYIAAEMAGISEAIAAAQRGIESARRMLKQRAARKL